MCKAFLVLRANVSVFINLLTLMLVCELDELTLESIGFMKTAFFLDKSEEEA